MKAMCLLFHKKIKKLPEHGFFLFYVIVQMYKRILSEDFIIGCTNDCCPWILKYLGLCVCVVNAISNKACTEKKNIPQQ